MALRFGHRLSVDLDFFTPDSFDSQSIADELTRDFLANEVRVNPAGINLMIRGVKVDFVRYRYALLQPFETCDGVRLFGLKDNIAMKLSAITNRGAKKDFFDLHQLIKAIGLTELIAIYREKYPAQDAFVLLRSLAYFEDAIDELDPESLDGTTWEEVQSSIKMAVRAFL